MDGSTYEERTVSEKRSRAQSSSVVTEKPQDGAPIFQEMLSEELNHTTEQLLEASSTTVRKSCDGQHERNVAESTNNEKELRELCQWKVEAERRIKRLEPRQ